MVNGAILTHALKQTFYRPEQWVQFSSFGDTTILWRDFKGLGQCSLLHQHDLVQDSCFGGKHNPSALKEF